MQLRDIQYLKVSDRIIEGDTIEVYYANQGVKPPRPTLVVATKDNVKKLALQLANSLNDEVKTDYIVYQLRNGKKIPIILMDIDD